MGRAHRPPAAFGRTVAEPPRPRWRPPRNDARQASKENRRSVAWSISWWSSPQRPSLGDGRAVWRIEYSVARRLYLLTYPVRVRDDEPESERNRPVNSEGSVNQRFREFCTEISGCEGNPGGSLRTPSAISRNGERRSMDGIVVNRYDERPETKGPRRPISRRQALTGVRTELVEIRRTPRAQPSS